MTPAFLFLLFLQFSLRSRGKGALLHFNGFLFLLRFALHYGSGRSGGRRSGVDRRPFAWGYCT